MRPLERSVWFVSSAAADREQQRAGDDQHGRPHAPRDLAPVRRLAEPHGPPRRGEDRRRLAQRGDAATAAPRSAPPGCTGTRRASAIRRPRRARTCSRPPAKMPPPATNVTHSTRRRTSPATGSRRTTNGSISRVPTRSIARVGRDGHARREREQDRRVDAPAPPAAPPPAATRHGRWSHEEPGEQRRDPDRPGDAQPLAEDRDPDRDREQRRRPAGHRVDDRQVAAPIGGRRAGRSSRPRRRPTRPPSATPSIGSARPPARATTTRSRPGRSPTDAASIPTVAARSGSPAVLSRTFHATCRTAETATSAMIRGSTPGRYLSRSRRCRPHAPTQQAADREDDRDDDARPGRRRRPSAGRGACR